MATTDAAATAAEVLRVLATGVATAAPFTPEPWATGLGIGARALQALAGAIARGADGNAVITAWESAEPAFAAASKSERGELARLAATETPAAPPGLSTAIAKAITDHVAMAPKAEP